MKEKILKKFGEKKVVPIGERIDLEASGLQETAARIGLKSTERKELGKLWKGMSSEQDVLFSAGNPICTVATEKVGAFFEQRGYSVQYISGEYGGNGHWFPMVSVKDPVKKGFYKRFIVDFGDNITQANIKSGHIIPRIIEYKPGGKYVVEDFLNRKQFARAMKDVGYNVPKTVEVVKGVEEVKVSKAVKKIGKEGKVVPAPAPSLPPTPKPKLKPKKISKPKPKPTFPKAVAEPLPSAKDVPLPKGVEEYMSLTGRTLSPTFISPKQMGAYADWAINEGAGQLGTEAWRRLVEALPQKYADDFARKLLKMRTAAPRVHAIESGHFLPKLSPTVRMKIINKTKDQMGIIAGKTFGKYDRAKQDMIRHFWVYDNSFIAGMNTVERKVFVKEMIQEGWAGSSRSISSQILQQAMKEVTGSKAPLWNSSSTYSLERVMSEIPEKVKQSVRALVKETYESTQNWLKEGILKKKIIVVKRSETYGGNIVADLEIKNGKIKLLRGVKTKEVVQSPLSSWTNASSVAQKFDGEEILEVFIDPKDIYVCVGSPGWGGMTKEYEFIRIAR